MELEDVRSNLHSLLKLYGLLQSSEESLLSAGSVNLDDNAKLFLKNLLDRATERVFDTHSKIIVAAQSSISNKPCSTPPEKSDATMKLQPPASRNISKASPTVLKRSSKDLKFHTNASLKDEQSLTKAMPEGKILELSKASIPPTKPESRKKHCRVCQQSSMNQPSLARGRTISHENIQIPNSCGNGQDQQEAHVQWETGHVKGLAPKNNVVDSVGNIEMSRQKRIREIKCNSSAVKPLASSSCASVTGFVKPSGEQSPAGATDKNLEDVDYITKEVADAIKRIKSLLQALRPPAEVVDPLNEKNPADKGSCRKASSISIADKVHPAVETKEEIVTRSELQAGGGSVLSGKVLSSRQISQRPHKFNDSGPANNVVSQSQKPISVASDLQSQVASQEPLRKSNDLLSQLGSQKNGHRRTTTLPGNALNLLMKPTGEGLDLQNQYDAKNVKAIEEKIESLSRLKSENDRLPSHVRNCVHGLRVSPSQVKLGQGSTFIAKMPSRVNKVNAEQDPMPQNETTGNSSTSTPSLLPQSLDPIDFVLPNTKTQVVRPRHKMNQTQARALNRKNNLPYQAVMRPTLLDCSSSKIMVQPTLYDERTEDKKVRGIHKNVHVGPQSRIVQRPQISEETSSSFGSSSSWTSQPTNTSCSGSESESESEGYLPPRRRGSQLSGSTSRRSGRVARFSSSGELSSFSHGRGSNYRSVGSSRREYPKKEFRTEGQMNTEKQTGRLRRLKNKLGLVFHHHHHHHHHNHNNDDDSGHAEAAHAMSLWRKIFHHSNKKKVYDDHSVKKSRKKAVISNVPSKNQQGQFHSLVEGLMRHVRHSKKSKHSKGGIGRLGNDQHGHNKKVVKKLHWWQMLKRKRGVKLSNKGRLKLGYTSKKIQLRGAKMR